VPDLKVCDRSPPLVFLIFFGASSMIIKGDTAEFLVVPTMLIISFEEQTEFYYRDWLFLLDSAAVKLV
jgi:hypothetical protein